MSTTYADNLLVKLIQFLCCLTINNLHAQQPTLVLPVGHVDCVNHAAFSPDGRWVVTASLDGTAKIWNARTGQLITDLVGNQAGITSAVFSPDGKSILTALEDTTAKVWDAVTGELLLNLRGHGNGMKYAVFSFDGKTILAAALDGTAMVWNTSDGQLITHLSAQTYGGIKGATFSSDGKLVLQPVGETVKIRDAVNGELISDLIGHFNYVNNAAFSPDGKLIVTSSDDGSAKVWQTVGGKLKFSLIGHTNKVNSAEFSPNGKLIMTTSDDGTARIWNTFTGQLVFNLKGNKEVFRNFVFRYAVRKAAFSTDGTSIITVSDDNIAKVWSAISGKLRAILKGHTDWISSAVFSIDGKFIVTASCDKTAKIWSAVTGRLAAELKGHTHQVNHALFSPDGQSILAASYDGTVKVFNAFNGQLKTDLKEYPNKVDDAVFSPDGKLILTKGDTIKIWNAATGQFINCLNNINHHFKGYVQYASFSLDGRSILTVYRGGPPKVWNTATGNLITELKVPLDHYSAQNGYFSPDGKSIVTFAFSDSVPMVWNATTGRVKAFLKGHTHHVTDAVFSQDGQWVVTASKDNTAKIWNAHTGDLQIDLKGHDDIVTGVAFSPDSKRVVTRALYDSVKIWKVPNGSLITTIEFENNERFESIDFVNNRIASSNNSEISVFDMESGKKLFSTIGIDSTDYLSRIATGYYMCTPKAAKLLHYVTKNSKVITFAQLDLRYNRPDKVLQSIGYPDTAVINSYRNVYYKRIKKLNIDTTAFQEGYSVPEADFINRDKINMDQTTETLQLHIQGTDSTYLLDRFNVWVNEVPLFGVAGIDVKQTKSNSFDTSFTITLSQGSNEIETSITNVNETESYRMPLLVKYSPRQLKKEKTYFIGFGINRFADNNYNLQWSVKDIRDLALKLKKIYKYNIEIDTLFDENVTVEKVTALKAKLKTSNINDKVIIAYSGHGLLSKEYDYFLSTHNVIFHDPRTGGMPYELLEQMLDSIPARKKLMLIDACHSGEIDKEDMNNMARTQAQLDNTQKGVTVLVDAVNKRVGSKNSFELMQELFVNVGRNTGATVISAAAGTQFALERGDLENGVFSYSILELMKKKTHVTVSELKRYVNKRVTELTNGMQVPTSRVDNNAMDWEVW